MRWTRDRSLWAAIAVGLVLRVLPLALWPFDSCVRDECTYSRLAKRFAAGQGMTESVDWLWAPGYPAFLGFHAWITSEPAVGKILQMAASLGAIVLVYLLAQRTFSRRPAAPGEPIAGQRAARWAAWLYALSAHQAFYAGRMWSEVLYGAILLGGLLLFGHARDAVSRRSGDGDQPSVPDHRRALRFAGLVGGVVGVCVLFRGVAQYMLPIFVLGFLWGRIRQRVPWMQAALAVAVTVAVVAPYSAYATHKFGDFVLSDRTAGRMMWLGNNTFEPITFDYGNGQLSSKAYSRTKNLGRARCAPKGEVIALDACQMEEGVAWIKANPEAFVRRMPMRVAQMLNPHSLLTRHLRWGKWKGMPQWLDEGIVLWQALGSMLVMGAGMTGLTTRGRGAQGGVFFAILLYHVAAISVLAGLSRYRVPLEPLLMIYAAGLLSDPRAAWREARESRLGWRVGATVVVMALVVPLILWYLPAGWPSWRTW